MIAIDTNLLVYAHRRESRFHDSAAALVRSLAEGSSAWSIRWPCLYEFFSVVTNPRIWRDRASRSQAARDQIAAWLSAPTLRLLAESAHFEDTLLPLLRNPRVRGPIVHDARVAALCIAHGVDELLTKDRDLQLFPQLRVRDPLTD